MVVGLFWIQHHENDDLISHDNSAQVSQLQNQIVNTLHSDGEQAVMAIIQGLQGEDKPTIYIVDESRKDLLGQTVDDHLWHSIANHDASLNFTKVKSHVSNKQYFVFVLDAHDSLHSPLNDAQVSSLTPHTHKRFRFPTIPVVVGVIVSFFFAFLLALNFSRPINSLKNAFDEVAKGNLDVGVAAEMASRKDEISELGAGFDQMLLQIKKLVEGQTRLLHHLSHEMRSPLTRLQIAVGLSKQGSSDIDSTIKRIELEVTRMDHLIGEVLDLSRLDSGIKQLSKEVFSFTELLAEILDDARFEAGVKGITIHHDIATNVALLANQELLHRAIENVVRNAIKYSAEGGVVDVKSHIKSDGFVSLTVTDQGTGVLDSELEDLFKPFFKGESAQKAGGYGLGLAIARQIVESHGGDIVARNQQPTGLCVEFTLPITTS